ncbi:alpha/beta fold hydrolase [bacterium]|nr:alpha/beta fold hydrolase [bacterium]
MTWWLVGLFVVGFGYLAVAMIFAARQEALFFKPKRDLASAPAEAGLAYEDVALAADGGPTFRGWWLPAPSEPHGPGAGLALLYLHGANTNLGDRVDALAFWHELGFAILAIDYRGYGRSEGRPSELGLYADTHAAWSWLTGERGLSPDRIVIAAESMGVSLATELGQLVRPAAMVLEAGFTRAADVAQRRYPWLPVKQMIRLQLASEDRIGSVWCPKLLVHSVADRTVPITLGRRLERRAAPPCRMLTVRGGHARACVEGGERYRRELERWLAASARPEGADTDA